MKKKRNDKLFYVYGLRHHAIVLAHDEKEAVKLSNSADEGDKNPKVLFGSVGEWENWNNSTEVFELNLPQGYKIVKVK